MNWGFVVIDIHMLLFWGGTRYSEGVPDTVKQLQFMVQRANDGVLLPFSVDF